MNIDRIKYSKKFPYAPYLNEDIGFEMSISAGQDPKECLKYLKELAEEFYKENTLPLLDAMRGTHERIIQEEKPPATGLQAIINDMNTCKDIKVLESYRLIVKNNPELQETYDNKLNQLQNV